MAIGEPIPYPMWNDAVGYYSAFPPPQGWQCPVCGRVYAPTVLTCFTKHRKPKEESVLNPPQIRPEFTIDPDEFIGLDDDNDTTT